MLENNIIISVMTLLCQLYFLPPLQNAPILLTGGGVKRCFTAVCCTTLQPDGFPKKMLLIVVTDYKSLLKKKTVKSRGFCCCCFLLVFCFFFLMVWISSLAHLSNNWAFLKREFTRVLIGVFTFTNLQIPETL